MTELGINSGFYTKDLLSKAKEIIFRHRELQAKALKLQSKVNFWTDCSVGLSWKAYRGSRDGGCRNGIGYRSCCRFGVDSC